LPFFFAGQLAHWQVGPQVHAPPVEQLQIPEAVAEEQLQFPPQVQGPPPFLQLQEVLLFATQLQFPPQVQGPPEVLQVQLLLVGTFVLQQLMFFR
jgi:hypothetical protein